MALQYKVVNNFWTVTASGDHLFLNIIYDFYLIRIYGHQTDRPVSFWDIWVFNFFFLRNFWMAKSGTKKNY